MYIAASLTPSPRICPRQHRKPVFQQYPPRGYISLDEARDAYELCQTIKDPRQREAAYLAMGLDPEHTDMYVPVVLHLEHMLDISDSKKD